MTFIDLTSPCPVSQVEASPVNCPDNQDAGLVHKDNEVDLASLDDVAPSQRASHSAPDAKFGVSLGEPRSQVISLLDSPGCYLDPLAAAPASYPREPVQTSLRRQTLASTSAASQGLCRELDQKPQHRALTGSFAERNTDASYGPSNSLGSHKRKLDCLKRGRGQDAQRQHRLRQQGGVLSHHVGGMAGAGYDFPRPGSPSSIHGNMERERVNRGLIRQRRPVPSITAAAQSSLLRRPPLQCYRRDRPPGETDGARPAVNLSHATLDRSDENDRTRPECDGESKSISDEIMAAKLQEEEDNRLAMETACRYEEEEEGHRRAMQDHMMRMEMDFMGDHFAGEAGHPLADLLEDRMRKWRSNRGTRGMQRFLSDANEQRRARRRAGPLAGFSAPGAYESQHDNHNRFPGGFGASLLPGLFTSASGCMESCRGEDGSRGPPSVRRSSPLFQGVIGRQGLREAMLGLAQSGLPPSLLLSDRDFTADDYELLCKLDEGVENRKGATQDVIDALPTHVLRPEEGRAAVVGQEDPGFLHCSICLEEAQEGSVLKSLPCLHKFHRDCIDKWLKQKAVCPVCQRSAAGF